MPQAPPSDGSGGGLSFTDKLQYGWILFDSFGVLSEPFCSICAGKRYYGRNVLFGLAVLVFWIVYHPEHETALTAFGAAWLAALAFQRVVGLWCHYFGTRQITTFRGIPLVSYVLPLGAHFCRRFVTPLIVFGSASLIDDQALAQLIRFSAVGQAVSLQFSYAVQGVDDDARSDAALMARSR